jgi:hypothetical protein
MSSFFTDLLLPYLESQVRDTIAPEFKEGGALRTRLDAINDVLMQTFQTEDLAERYRLLVSVLLATGILGNSAPSGVDTPKRLLMVVAFPRLCHAVLFVSDLLVDARSPFFLQQDSGLLWVQLTNVRESEIKMRETETSVANPLPFMRTHNFCLAQRQYEPSAVLNALAVEWGKQLWLQKVTVPPAHTLPYTESFGDMSLYEVCFCLCLEFASKQGWIKVLQRIGGSLRPFHWRVLDEAPLRALFPRYFFEPQALHTWTTRLCLVCCPTGGSQYEHISTALLRTGYDYTDLRFGSHCPSYIDWANELNSFIKLPS